VTRDEAIRFAALGVALHFALKRISELSGGDPRKNLELVRDQAVNLFKNANVPPERDMDQVRIVTPAIKILDELFANALAGVRSRATGI
jgi:hypothetical protein